MSFAAVLLFVPSAVLLLLGGATVWFAVLAARRRAVGRVALVLRMIAGIGTLGFAVLALSVLWSDQQYGIVLLPVLALVGAAVWNAALWGAAALAEWAARRRRTMPSVTRDRSR